MKHMDSRFRGNDVAQRYIDMKYAYNIKKLKNIYLGSVVSSTFAQLENG